MSFDQIAKQSMSVGNGIRVEAFFYSDNGDNVVGDGDTITMLSQYACSGKATSEQYTSEYLLNGNTPTEYSMRNVLSSIFRLAQNSEGKSVEDFSQEARDKFIATTSQEINEYSEQQMTDTILAQCK